MPCKLFITAKQFILNIEYAKINLAPYIIIRIKLNDVDQLYINSNIFTQVRAGIDSRKDKSNLLTRMNYVEKC